MNRRGSLAVYAPDGLRLSGALNLVCVRRDGVVSAVGMKFRPILLVGATLGLGGALVTARADAGPLLLQYQSQLHPLPMAQGWLLQSKCYDDDCPGAYCAPMGQPAASCNSRCWYQGALDWGGNGLPDNNCLSGTGCRKTEEYYNAPDAPAPAPPPPYLAPDPFQACTYTEWLVFDNGNNVSPHPLTIGDSYNAGCPPWGSPFFVHAPTYATLRISTGDGTPFAPLLPTVGQPPAPNNRNAGMLKLKGIYSISNGQSVTLVCKVAVGPRFAQHAFIQVRGNNRQFSFGFDGDSSSPTYGQITYGDVDGSNLGVLFSSGIATALPVPAPAPAGGEFFTLRAILRADGTISAWLNEQVSSNMIGATTLTVGSETVVSLTPLPDGVDTNDATLWVDYVQLLEGEVQPPPTCPDPVFDVNRDGYVRGSDMVAFMACSTGPAAPSAVWNALSDQCKCMDVNGDHAIDSTDFGVFQRCLTLAPDSPRVDPACDN
jgi:hypothetical protein